MSPANLQLWQLSWQLAPGMATAAVAGNPANWYADRLCELGAACVWVDEPDDPAQQMTSFQSFPGSLPDWQSPRLNALALSEETCNQLMLRVVTGCPELGLPAVTNPQTDPQQTAVPPVLDFNQLQLCTNQEAFNHATPKKQQAQLYIPAGLGFGTGTHPTTAMILNWCSRARLKSLAVLDYGCGSGILALAAIALGASTALAVDNDPQALEATSTNASNNGFAARVQTSTPEALPSHQPATYPVIFANILLTPLLQLAELLCRLLEPGGRLLLTGILTKQQDALLAAYERLPYSLQPVPDEQAQQDGWSLLVLTKSVPTFTR